MDPKEPENTPAPHRSGHGAHVLYHLLFDTHPITMYINVSMYFETRSSQWLGVWCF